ncbi:MAG: hypothetical protein CV089_20265 [Nitrospira sp. WS110]|nr:hypothetical protein [Nitrospira sp. WS110]
MLADALLSRLEQVHSRGAGKWAARCPAHADKSPSLSIREVEDGQILVHCFSGCPPKEICGALGLSLRDLFGDSRQDHSARPLPPQRADLATLAFRFYLHSLDLQLRGESVLQAAQYLDTSEWSDQERGIAMQAVSNAYHDLDRAELFSEVAFQLRLRHLTKEYARYGCRDRAA